MIAQKKDADNAETVCHKKAKIMHSSLHGETGYGENLGKINEYMRENNVQAILMLLSQIATVPIFSIPPSI